MKVTIPIQVTLPNNVIVDVFGQHLDGLCRDVPQAWCNVLNSEGQVEVFEYHSRDAKWELHHVEEGTEIQRAAIKLKRMLQDASAEDT